MCPFIASIQSCQLIPVPITCHLFSVVVSLVFFSFSLILVAYSRAEPSRAGPSRTCVRALSVMWMAYGAVTVEDDSDDDLLLQLSFIIICCCTRAVGIIFHSKVQCSAYSNAPHDHWVRPSVRPSVDSSSHVSLLSPPFSHLRKSLLRESTRVESSQVCRERERVV